MALSDNGGMGHAFPKNPDTRTNCGISLDAKKKKKFGFPQINIIIVTRPIRMSKLSARTKEGRRKKRQRGKQGKRKREEEEKEEEKEEGARIEQDKAGGASLGDVTDLTPMGEGAAENKDGCRPNLPGLPAIRVDAG